MPRNASRFSINKIKDCQMKRCALCGSTASLETHHIVPLACGGPDTEDNILIVCRKCHAILTPLSILTKIGLKKANERNHPKIIQEKFYNKVKEAMNGTKYCLDATDVMDIFDSIIEDEIAMMRGVGA